METARQLSQAWPSFMVAGVGDANLKLVRIA